MTHGSLFAGIGGFDLGFERAGFETRWQVEIEPFCEAVLKTRFPKANLHADIRDCGRHSLDPVDVITAGVPCQDVSVAGKRAGLAGERTGLFYEFARILRELRPAWFVFENVPGLLSSNRGRDFAEVLRVLMVECGYGVCWRVLDSQFFGVAQRRRRVFVVGSLGKPCPVAVLFEREGCKGDFAKGRKAGADVAYALAASAESHIKNAWNTNYIAATLRESDGHHGRSRPRGDGCDNLVCNAVQGLGSGGPDDNEAQGGHLVCATLRGGGDTPKSHRKPSGTDRSPLVCSSPDADGVRDFAGLPEGMDSARYRALGNAVTVQVAEWIARRILKSIG